MRRYKITKGEAVDLQEWTLIQSGTKQFLDSLRILPKKGKVKHGLYVDFVIDENELDGGVDWPDVSVASVYAIVNGNNEKIFLGEVRAYNWETYWLSTIKFDEVYSAKEWQEIILKDYEKIKAENEVN